MTRSLRMGNKKIINLTNPTNNTDAANKAYIETGFLKLPDGTMTGVLNLPQNPNITIIQALNQHSARVFVAQINDPYVYKRFNMVDNNIINLADPTDNKDADNKHFLEQEIHKSLIKPSHKTNQFVLLMQNTFV